MADRQEVEAAMQRIRDEGNLIGVSGAGHIRALIEWADVVTAALDRVRAERAEPSRLRDDDGCGARCTGGPSEAGEDRRGTVSLVSANPREVEAVARAMSECSWQPGDDRLWVAAEAAIAALDRVRAERICDHCDGTGQVYEPAPADAAHEYDCMGEDIPCANCGGTGRVQRGAMNDDGTRSR